VDDAGDAIGFGRRRNFVQRRKYSTGTVFSATLRGFMVGDLLVEPRHSQSASA
jgi:hypothetical protein